MPGDIPDIESLHLQVMDQGLVALAGTTVCVGAKSSLSKDQLRVLVARDLTSCWDDMRIDPALLAFAVCQRRQSDLFQNFAVLFEGPDNLDEEGFERHLWDPAQSVADKDAWLGHPWDDRVIKVPDNSQLGFTNPNQTGHLASSLPPTTSRSSTCWRCDAAPPCSGIIIP